MKKHRFYYYEDEDIFDYINNLPHWQKSKWVRKATRTSMENDLKVIHIQEKKVLAHKIK